MPKVILICGKLCCGKSTYAKELCMRNKAVLLSIDEIMLSMFGQHCGDMHDTYAERTRNYLFAKSVELIASGIDVILDWGFWTKDGRDTAKSYYRSRGIACELHYIDVGDETWQARLNKRNAAVSSGETLAYYVDENLAAKFAARFEPQFVNEVDVHINT